MSRQKLAFQTRETSPSLMVNQAEAAKRLGVCAKTLREWTEKGVVPCLRVPGTRRVLYNLDALASLGK